MASTTGIELGPDTCVLAGVRTTRAGNGEIVALHTIDPGAWPAHDVAFTAMLRSIRTSKRFPRHARVVAWGLPEDASDDAVSRAALRPLIDAGFRIDRMVTPPQALAILASTRVRPGVQNTGVAWLALNMHGAAIAIVRGSELLFARTFQWAYNPHLLDGKSQLLQRYSLISHLAPEVRRGMAAVRASHGIPVDAAVTCGDLPELRSLTMPLIEELDLEVETLDSLDGLSPVGRARLERPAESAPAIRLACAMALDGVQRPRTGPSPIARLAAAAAIVALLGYGAYAYVNHVVRPAARARTSQAPAGASAKPPANAQQQKPAPVVAPQPAPVQATSAKAEPVAPNLSPAARAKAEPGKLFPPARLPVPTVKPPVQTAAKDSKAPRAPAIIAKPIRPSAKREPLPPTPTSPEEPSAKADAVAPKPDLAIAAEQQIQRSTDTRGVVFPPATRRVGEQPQVPLKDPLPKVDSILIDQDRRLAIIEGTVAAVGDRVGPRVIVQIDRDLVVLREPSGLLVRVPIRSHQVSFGGITADISGSYNSGIAAVANGRDHA